MDYLKLSKTLSWLLRHHVIDMKLKISNDGYVLIDDILKLKQFKDYVLDDIKYVVKNDKKIRFN
jgi:RNA:NAD 2'-phosphotransferase (TPT1/KptA family)